MTADDDDVDDASLKSMRAVWLSMRDEEPPSAGMSALLAAAAQKADQMRDEAKPAWWERVFAMLRKPPVLAFASVMLLIGGAVLVTRSSQEPVDSMTAGPSEQADVKSAEKIVAPDAAVVSGDDSIERDIAQPIEPPVATPADTKDVVTPPPPVKRRQAPKPEKVQTYKEEVKALEDKPKVGTKGEAGRGDTAGTVLESPPPPPPPPAPTTGSTRPSRTPPMTEAPVAKPTTEPEPSTDSVTLSDRGAGSKPSTPPVEQLARQAESAATRGDCAAVRTIATRIKQQDETFYKQRILKNAAIAKCL